MNVSPADPHLRDYRCHVSKVGLGCVLVGLVVCLILLLSTYFNDDHSGAAAEPATLLLQDTVLLLVFMMMLIVGFAVFMVAARFVKYLLYEEGRQMRWHEYLLLACEDTLYIVISKLLLCGSTNFNPDGDGDDSKSRRHRLICGILAISEMPGQQKFLQIEFE